MPAGALPKPWPWTPAILSGPFPFVQPTLQFARDFGIMRVGTGIPFGLRRFSAALVCWWKKSGGTGPHSKKVQPQWMAMPGKIRHETASWPAATVGNNRQDPTTNGLRSSRWQKRTGQRQRTALFWRITPMNYLSPPCVPVVSAGRPVVACEGFPERRDQTGWVA